MHVWSRAATALVLGLYSFIAGCGDDPVDDPAEPDAPIAVVYVDASAAAGGDGTASAPFDTLDAALRAIASLAADAIVAPIRIDLAAGEYAAPSEPWGRVVVTGAGPDATTILAASAPQQAEALSFDSLALASAEFVATEQLSLVDIRLSNGAVVLAAPDVALDAIRGDAGQWRIEAERTVAFDVVAQSTRVQIVGGTLEASDWSLTEGDGPLVLLEQVTGTLADSMIVDAGFVDGVATQTTTEDFGAGLVVEGGGIALERVQVTRSRERGVNVRGGRLVGQDVVIRGAGVAGLAVQRWAFGGEPGASVAAEVTMDALEVSGANVLAVVNGSTLVLREAFLENGAAAGILASDGARLEIYDSTVLRCDNGHISLLGAETTGVLASNVIRGAAVESCVAVSGAQADVQIRDNTISECAGSGVALLGVRGVTVARNDVSVIAPSPLFPDVNEGISMVGSVADVDDNLVHDTLGAGIALLDSAGTVRRNRVVDVGDAGIRSVSPGPTALSVVENIVTRATVAGVLVLDSTALVQGNTISETRFSAEFGSGMGVGAAGASTVEVLENTLRANAQNGVFVDTTVQGEVADNTIEDNGGYGIACGGTTSMVIEDNVLSGNASGAISALCGIEP